MQTRLSRPDTHTSTQQWQSFEIKMRHRRAERCVARAQELIAAGHEDDARAALAEARALTSDTPPFEQIVDAVRQREAAAAAEKRARQQRTIAAAAVVVLAVAAGSIALWLRTAGPGEANTAPIAAPSGQAATPSIVQPPHRQVEIQKPQAPQGSAGPSDAPTVPEFPVRTAGLEARTPAATSLAATPPPARPQVTEPALPAVREVHPSLPLDRPPAGGTGSVESAIPRTHGADGLVRTLPRAALPIVTMTPPPAVAEPRPAEPPEVSEEPKVRAVLSEFESAYSSLNAAAAQAVWPSVDAGALSRAFDSLQSQHVSLGRCSILIKGSSARAECSGTASWTPKVGGGRHTAGRRWEFDLAAENGTWQILQATAK